MAFRNISQSIGNKVDEWGTKLGAKDYGISEFLAGGKPTTNTGYTQTSKNAGFVNYSPSTYIPNMSYAPRKEVTNDKTGLDNTATKSLMNTGSLSQVDGPSLDDLYQPSYDFLNKLGKSLKSQKGNIEKEATSPYDAQIPLIQQAYEAGKGKIEGAKGEAGNALESALSQARRLFDEYSQRNRQVFGGSDLSSVAQAAGEILGRSAQEQFGSARNQYGQTMQGLAQKAIDLQGQADSQIQNVKLLRDQALAQARQAFRARLDEIDSKKNQLNSAKAEAKYEALLELRDKVQGVKDRANQFLQGLEAQKQQSMLVMREQIAKAAAEGSLSTQDAQNMLNTYVKTLNTLPSSLIDANSVGTDTNAPQDLLSMYTGFYGNGDNTDENTSPYVDYTNTLG